MKAKTHRKTQKTMGYKTRDPTRSTTNSSNYYENKYMKIEF